MAGKSKNGVDMTNIHVSNMVNTISRIVGHSPTYRDALKGTTHTGCGRKYKWHVPSRTIPDQFIGDIRKAFPYLQVEDYGWQISVKIYISDISYMEDMAQTNLMDYPECEG